MTLIGVIALAKFLFHLHFNNRYGYFIDEFNYIACGDHLAWGYVDHPPLIPFLAHLSRALLGDSLRSIRFVPALASSLLVVQTALIAREFGARLFALLFSAVTVLVAPFYLSDASLLTTNCLEPNLWMGCAYFAILAVKRNDPRYWLGFGVIAGLGLEEKYTIALFGAGIVIGLLLTVQRRFFLDRWIWLGGLVAFLVFLPNLIWNVRYHWPFLELIHNIRVENRDVVLPAGQYFFQQTLLINPLAAPIWIAGLVALLFSVRLRPYRFLGWAYLVCYLVLFVQHGKNYYLAPIYPVLLAAGAVVIEAALDRPSGAWLKPAIVGVLLATGAYLAPVSVPVLSPDHFITYMNHLPFKLPVMEHRHQRVILPQWYADQFGWREIVDETAEAWNKLAPEERADCAIFAQNYGQAGAIDFLGPRFGLPRAISGHQTYFLWGPRGYSGKCMVVVGDPDHTLPNYFDHVELVGVSADNPYALQKQIGVFICHGPKFGTLAQIWPSLKRWQ